MNKIQRAVRSYPSQNNALQETLNKGWVVAHITTTSEYIEYIVEMEQSHAPKIAVPTITTGCKEPDSDYVYQCPACKALLRPLQVAEHYHKTNSKYCSNCGVKFGWWEEIEC
jgi:hypothetical protein